MRISDWSSDACSSDLDAGNDRHVDAGGGRAVDEAEEHVGVEEELGNRPGGPGIDLALQIVEVDDGVGGLWVHLGIGGDADLEIARPPQSFDQIGADRKSVV